MKNGYLSFEDSFRDGCVQVCEGLATEQHQHDPDIGRSVKRGKASIARLRKSSEATPGSSTAIMPIKTHGPASINRRSISRVSGTASGCFVTPAYYKNRKPAGTTGPSAYAPIRFQPADRK